MSTTTPNFGWQVPTSTDYVKDGAVAIETLGDAIDASLVDLKGGTTGQVLSKATNTDMDFVWVTPDDADAIQNSIVDAKGDLIAATAADTPARLAVGTNGQVLTADSTTATGLKWATSSSGSLTLLSTTTLNGATSYTVTNLDQTYTCLTILISGVTVTTAQDVSLTLKNGSTGLNCFVTGVRSATGANQNSTTLYLDGQGNQWSALNTNNAWLLQIFDYANTSNRKPLSFYGYFNNDSSGNYVGTWGGSITSASAVNAVTIQAGSNFTAGTMKIYGVK